MIKVNAIGDACPIPVVKTMDAIKGLSGPDTVETSVDNEVAVKNLTKLANQKGYGVTSEKISDKEYKVTLTIGENADTNFEGMKEECLVPANGKKRRVVVLSSECMGNGSEELGKTLMKGFIYALSQQEELPDTILLFNGGAKLSTEGSLSIEDLQNMADAGVEILTCGTCLNFYGLTEKLKVGEVTNMYDIVEKMNTADLIIKP